MWSSGFPDLVSYLLVKVFPVILCHQSKQGKEGPAKGVEACVTIVGVRTTFVAFISLWTLPAGDREPVKLKKNLPFPYSPFIVLLIPQIKQKCSLPTQLCCCFHKAMDFFGPECNNKDLKGKKKKKKALNICAKDCGCQTWFLSGA